MKSKAIIFTFIVAILIVGTYVISVDRKKTIDTTTVTATTQTNSSEFIIKDGVLTKYIGASREVVIPESVTSIGIGAFSDCLDIEDVIIPDSVTNIGDFAFSYCTSLLEIKIPSSTNSIGENAFGRCLKMEQISVDGLNKNFLSQDGVLFNRTKTELIQCPAGKTGSYSIPNTVITIRNYAFSSCESLSNVIIPYGVENIGNDAFNCCYELTSVVIPESVKTIGKAAFYGSIIDDEGRSKLANIEIPGSVTSIGEDAFGATPWLKNYPYDLVIVGDQVLYSYEGISSRVVIPGNIKRIGDGAFAWFEGQSVTIPNSVISIGKNAFFYCQNIESITIPNSVISIGDGAFSSCDNLLTINIHSNVKYIGAGAFACASLSEIIVDENNTHYSSQDGVLFNKANTSLLQYPFGKAGNYIVPDTVTSIEGDTFRRCFVSTKYITIPSSVINIDISAFEGSNNITVLCPAGSFAETYATNNRITYSNI